ncbi:MAG: hypothetical protein K2M45_04100 [Muribaculaceae bacterium]|nr:hypothetical protein [Muribaculaceae bacterium]
MDESRKVKMEVIVGRQRVNLNVDFMKQNFVRETEDDIHRIYTTLAQRFPRKDESELLAMIVYQYASYYRELLAIHDEALRMALDCEKEIDKITDTPDPNP